MIRSLPSALALLVSAALSLAAVDAPAAAPAASPAAETTAHTEGGAFKPFYAEVFHQRRYYLFGTKPEFARFTEAGYAEMNPLKSRMFIGKGPGRATVVVETAKDTPKMAERLMKQFRARHNLGD